ncbi:MAG: PP2C family protein-serine/threonine phosphatase [Actinomycetota bacterium]
MRDLLTDVVRATASATDSATILDRSARVLLAVADWVIADRLDDPDLVVRVAAYDADGALTLPAAMGSGSPRRSSAGSQGLLPSLLRSPDATVHLRAPQLAAMAASGDPHRAAQAAMALSYGANEVLLIRLAARDLAVGVLSLGTRTTFGADDVTALADVAAHLGVALEAARLLEVQRAVATALQTSLLPPVPSVAGVRLAARYSPATRGLDVGGDWYDAFEVDGDLVVVIGDVSGHDVSAAARMAALRHTVRAHAVDRAEPPAAVVARLERTSATLALDATGTCVVARLHPDADGSWQLRWTNAGHPPPLLVRDGQAEFLETEIDLMLGVDPTSPRHDHERRLVPGDVLVLYTDGLVEVRGASLDDGLELLSQVAAGHAAKHPDALADVLLSRLGSGGADDVALLVLEVVGP